MILCNILIPWLLFTVCFAGDDSAKINEQIIAEMSSLVHRQAREYTNNRSNLELSDLLAEVQNLPLSQDDKNSLNSNLLHNSDLFSEFGGLCDKLYAITAILEEIQQLRDGGDMSHYRYNVARKYLLEERTKALQMFAKLTSLMRYIGSSDASPRAKKVLKYLLLMGLLYTLYTGVQSKNAVVGIPSTIALMVVMGAISIQLEKDFGVVEFLLNFLED